MPDVLPAIDPNVVIPSVIKQAGENADALHKAMYSPEPAEPLADQGEQPAGEQGERQPERQPEQPAQEPVQGTERLDPVAPQPVRAAVPESGEHGSWEHRYLAMKGRFDQSQITVGQMQEQMSELGDELVRTQQALQLARAGLVQGRQQQDPARRTPPRTVTEHDIETYGPELVDFVARAARGAVAPDLDQVSQQVRHTSQRVQQSAQHRMEADLDRQLPTWREINTSPRFKQWVSLRDIYSGQVRRNLIGDAAKAADAPRVAAFFQAFLNEEQATGQIPAPQSQPQEETPPAPRQAAMDLGAIASPGRAKPASGNGVSVAADKPVFTRAQVKHFYSNEGRMAYSGREADRKRDENAIFAAQNEGRIR